MKADNFEVCKKCSEKKQKVGQGLKREKMSEKERALLKIGCQRGDDDDDKKKLGGRGKKDGLYFI